ncbi:uncharacterized protein LOC103965227 [Pyrus x bretschneideri]|uniref:uncharacterized protein LOC103965227 n=1 Tax=Pyrus x bretschneideri TaxID=225117 RepID=UPI00202E7CC6|nr:uncharacterized protein LOC103965227 [Pyrus x bretschneideri]
MGDRRRRIRAMQMAQYQTSLDIEDAEMINAEAELANSLMQYEHHAESSYRGSVTGRSFVQRDREECHDRMMKYYFIERSKFPAHDFRRKIDVVGRQSLSPHQKLTFAFRMLTNGWPVDSIDEYCRLAKTTDIENLKRFYGAIQAIYGATYLRKPNREDLKRLMRKADKRGFLGMVNGNRYELGYYLTDCIYPSWSAFVKGFSHPDSAKKKLFSQRQESYRKDVEKAFGILQA